MDTHSFDPFYLDLHEGKLLRDGVDLRARPQVVQVLRVFIEHPGVTVSIEDLALWAWGEEQLFENGKVIVTIHETRKLLGEYKNLIRTVPGGYRFEHPHLQVKSERYQGQRLRRLLLTTFEDITREQAKAYLAEGITHELATTLSRLGNLRLIKAQGRQDFQALADQGAREVEYLVEGSVGGTEQRANVHVRLIACADRTIVWSETYRVTDFQSIQQTIAAKIAEAINVNINLEEVKNMQSDERVDSETYKLYLHGLYHWSRPTEVDLFRALEYFRQVNLRKPYAKAFGAMAHTYGLLGLGGYLRPDRAMPQAKSAALKCLELSPNSPEGLSGMAAVEAYYLWNWKRAEELLKQAIALNPNYDTGHHLYAMGCLMPQGRLDEALRQISAAWELNPLSPFIATCVGIVHFYMRNYDRSIEQFDRALELQPHYHLAHWHRGWTLIELKRFHEAVSALEGAVEMSHDSPQVIAALGQVYAAAEQVRDARRVLRQLKQIAAERYVSPYDVALIHISLGDNAKALGLLKDAVDQRAPAVTRLRVHPLFDRFHSNPQFLGLLRTMNLDTESPFKTKSARKRQKKSVVSNPKWKRGQ